MESARERLRLLEAGEVSEDEARALLDELARRRAETHEHPMLWWIRRTAWVPRAALAAIVAVFIAGAVPSDLPTRISAMARRNPWTLALFGISLAMVIYMGLSILVPWAMERAREMRERRLLG